VIEDQESIEGFLVFDHLEPDASNSFTPTT